MEKLKRVVIKEELVCLTGDAFSALALNQYIYWIERMNDVDKYIKEEKERDPDLEIELTHGWIYKTAKDLHDELMLGESLSERSLRRIIDKLVDAGWLDRRNNPKVKWDRTYQYRPNIRRIQIDLQELGFSLENYPLINGISFISASDRVSNASDRVSVQSVAVSHRTYAPVTAITEINSEITNKDIKSDDIFSRKEKETVKLLSSAIIKCCNLNANLLTARTIDEITEFAKSLRKENPNPSDEQLAENIKAFAIYWKGKSNDKVKFEAPTLNVMRTHWQNYITYCKEELNGQIPVKQNDNARVIKAS
jgi:hypothetical protein